MKIIEDMVLRANFSDEELHRIWDAKWRRIGAVAPEVVSWRLGSDHWKLRADVSLNAKLAAQWRAYRLLEATKNVAAAQRAPKVDDVDEVAIIEENRLKELMSRLEGHPVYPKVIVALFTGMRRGELLALRWNAVDVDKKMLRVREA